MDFQRLEIYIIIAIMVMILATIIIGVVSWLNSPESEPVLKNYKYQKRNFMTPNEVAVLKSLYKMSSQHNYLIFAKVRMWDLLEPNKGMGYSDKKAAELVIGQQRADFVLCDKTTFQPALILKLADSTGDRGQERTSRQKIDGFITVAYESAGLPVLYIRDIRHLEDELRILLRLPVSEPSGIAAASEPPETQEPPS